MSFWVVAHAISNTGNTL